MTGTSSLQLDSARRLLLTELGVVRYVPRSRVAVSAELQSPAPAQALAAPRVAPTALPAARVAPQAGMAFGTRTMRFVGPANAWVGLRAHLLRAFAGVEASTEVEVMFGGRGNLLTLPALGALASNPALKRQAWMALRALRRATA